MHYKMNDGVFVRFEKTIEGKNVFIFVGSTNEMYESTKEIYDVIELIKQQLTIPEIAEQLLQVYTGSQYDAILKSVEDVITYLLETEVICKYD